MVIPGHVRIITRYVESVPKRQEHGSSHTGIERLFGSAGHVVSSAQARAAWEVCAAESKVLVLVSFLVDSFCYHLHIPATLECFDSALSTSRS